MQLYRYDLVNCENGALANPTCYVEACVKDDKFLVRFIAEEIYRSPKYNQFNEPLYEGDIVEILLSLGSRNRYLEVEVNQNGAIYLAVINNIDGKGNIDVKMLDDAKGISAVVGLEDRLWTTDIAIPISVLNELGFDKNNVFVNFLREDFDEKGEMHLFAVSPTYCRSFHKPQAFISFNIF